MLTCQDSNMCNWINIWEGTSFSLEDKNPVPDRLCGAVMSGKDKNPINFLQWGVISTLD